MLQGTLRVLLVLLHDLPEFLCEFHFELVSHVPTSCVQMRNLILSAFPRTMRLPDPFTPNLKVSQTAKQAGTAASPPLPFWPHHVHDASQTLHEQQGRQWMHKHALKPSGL